MYFGCFTLILILATSISQLIHSLTSRTCLLTNHVSCITSCSQVYHFISYYNVSVSSICSRVVLMTVGELITFVEMYLCALCGFSDLMSLTRSKRTHWLLLRMALIFSRARKIIESVLIFASLSNRYPVIEAELGCALTFDYGDDITHDGSTPAPRKIDLWDPKHKVRSNCAILNSRCLIE